jgi:hypothetical protein
LGHFVSSFMRATVRSRPHVHIERDDCEAKFWLDPVRLERSRGFRRKEIYRLQELVAERRQHLLESWDEFFQG